MKKFLILSILSVFLIPVFIITMYFPHSPCKAPMITGYDLCCKDMFGRIFSCKNKEIFKCGENISSYITIYDEESAYICVNSTTLPANVSCFWKKSPYLFLKNEWGEVPYFNGKINLLEVYRFSDENITLEDLKRGEKILIVSRRIIC